MKGLFRDQYGMTILGGATMLTIVIVLLIVVTIGTLYLLDKKTCSELAQINIEYEFQFSFWTGCLVKNSFDYWVSTDLFDYIQADIKGK